MYDSTMTKPFIALGMSLCAASLLAPAQAASSPFEALNYRAMDPRSPAAAQRPLWAAIVIQ